ncbi:MAG: hypothetical protein POG24_06745, partial [Acidocella sp.]|nr:hypothetical protein [Acidocella sp.]
MAAISLAMCMALSACSGSTEEGPIGLWHQIQGGPLAAGRPAAPGLSQSYPRLGSVPAIPKPISPTDRVKTYALLATDRNNASFEAKSDPLVEAGATRAENGLFAPAPPITPSADAAGANLPAASPSPAHNAPMLPAQPSQTKLQVASGSAAPPHSPVDQPIQDITEDASPPPPIPQAPPPQPHIDGVVLPVTVPHLPPVAPTEKSSPAALDAAARAPITLAFSDGSAVPTIDDRSALQGLAAKRGPHRIEIIGFGDAAEEDGHSQVSGVDLGLARAQAAAI